MTPFNVLFFLTFTIFSFCQAEDYTDYIVCNGTERACPQNSTCSEDGQFCHQNGTSDLWSKWSLLKSACLDEKLFCGPDAYCLEESRFCIQKDISMCESYLGAIETTGCNNAFLTESFEFCKHYYFRRCDFPYQQKAIIQCADLCLRTEISNAIITDKASCNLLEKYAVGNFSRCYTNCGACLDQSIWHQIFENIKKWGDFNYEFGRDFAEKCSKEFLNKEDIWTVSELKSAAHKLIYSTSRYLNVDTSDLFGKVMAMEGYKDLDLNKIRILVLFLFSIIVISFIIICALCIIICKKCKKKISPSEKGKYVEDVYEMPRFNEIYTTTPPVPKMPSPDPDFSKTNFYGDNYGYESTATIISVGEEGDWMEMPIKSTIRK